MTIKELIEKGVSKLKDSSKTPQLDCEILLLFVLRKDSVYLLVNKDERVEQREIEKFKELVLKRKKGSPVAYLINTKEFYSLPFYVNKNVLIPRPETEDLVDLAFIEIQKKINEDKDLKKMVICDVGTGSGCIGVSLINRIINEEVNKKYFFEFVLTDISKKALKVARKNYDVLIKEDNNIKVDFIKTNLLERIRDDMDIIVSNPPYIPKEKIKLLDHSVRDFEPEVALDGGDKGLKIVRKLIYQSVKKLNEDGTLLFEIYEDQPINIKFFVEENLVNWNVDFKKDSFGEWRYAIIERD